MKRKFVIFTSVLAISCYVASNANAQWYQDDGSSVPAGSTPVLDFAIVDSNLYAGTANGGLLIVGQGGGHGGSYFGSGGPNGNAFAVIGATLFAGNASGVTSSNDTGSGWGAGWTALKSCLLGKDISALTVIGTNLFAASGHNVDSGVFLSTDSGKSWSNVSNGLTGRALNVFTMAACGTNLFVGTFGGVFRSTDNGKTWTAANNGLNDNLVECFASIGTNIFAGVYDTIFRSTDSGLNWIPINVGATASYPFAVYGTNLFAVGPNGTIFLSTNYGDSWVQIGPNRGGILGSDALVVYDSILFLGTNDGIWQCTLSYISYLDTLGQSMVTPHRANPLEIGSYPNPLSQLTSISFTTPESGVAKVSIVNMLGTEVANIFSGELAPGDHSFTWDASEMAAGLYICRLESCGVETSTKIVVLK